MLLTPVHHGESIRSSVEVDSCDVIISQTVVIMLSLFVSINLKFEPAMVDGEHKRPFVALLEVVRPVEVHFTSPAVFPDLTMHVRSGCVQHDLPLFWSWIEMKCDLKICVISIAKFVL